MGNSDNVGNPKFAINKLMLKEGQLFLYDDIDYDLAPVVSKAIMYLSIKYPDNPIILNIDSPGGQIYNGFSIMNAIKFATERGIKVIGRVTGLAASMAVLVLQACTERVACANSRIMIHEVSQFKMLSRESASQAEEQVKELQKINNLIIEIIAKRCGKDTKKVKNLVKKTDAWMSPKEALEYGLIDKIEE